MSQKYSKVLVVGPGKKVRGGITSVIFAHSTSKMWITWKCYWLETYDDRNNYLKISAAILGLLKFISIIWMFDIVHIHISHNMSFKRKSIFFWIAKLYGKKVILHVHASNGKVITSNMNLVHWYAKWVLRSADIVIALSPRYASNLQDYCKDAKITVISNPCLRLNEGESIEHADVPTVFFAGWLDENKGFCDLIKAMSLVKHIIPDAQLLLAGFGAVERGRSLSRSLDIESSIHFLGWLSGDEMAKTFQRTDVFCLPSFNEGVPVALLEAMGYGLPVVCTPVGGIPDVIEDNINGVFVSPGDVDEIANAIIKILTDADFRIKIGLAAMQTINNCHSVDVVCNELEKMYCKLIVDTALN